MPPGLLLAVGQIESGRWDARLGRTAPWPWTIDADGQGQTFESKAEAVAAVRALQAGGRGSIDVGCFQINLLHHPRAFADLDQAFDPQANAYYAARFLVSLHAELGNWPDAVAAYHSATPELGTPYRLRVFAAWTGVPAISPDATSDFTMYAGVRVWGPGVAGSASPAIEIRGQSAAPLPHIVTPTR